MKKGLIFILAFVITSKTLAQVIYVSTTSNELYRLDMNDCSKQFITNVASQVYDISFHPNGNLYGISANGNFYEIDTLSGATNLVHDFNSNFFNQAFNSLTIGADGLVYTTGTDGELWTYDISTGIDNFHGFIGYLATGDMTFYDGNLYVAVNGDRVALIDIEEPTNSSIVVDEDIPGDIYGIVSFAEDCNDVHTYAITDGNSRIYEINFITNSLNFICDIDIEVGGGASTFEFLASSSIEIEDISETDPNCQFNNGSISINAIGGIGQISYSIDGLNFLSIGVFENLSEGEYTITIRDENDCFISREITLTNRILPEISNVVIENSMCGSSNGSITIFASGDPGPLQFSIDEINFQYSSFFDSLSNGIFTITVKDANDCTSTDEVEIETEDLPIIENVAILNSTCGNSNGSISILASGGTGMLEYSIDGIVFQQSNIFNSLSSGIFTITIQDDNSCTLTDEIEIESEDSPIIENVSIENTSCGGMNGSVTVLANGGAEPLIYSVDGINFQLSNVFNGLSSGILTIIIQDDNNCIITDEVEIESEDSPTIDDVMIENTTCGNMNGSVIILASGGTGTLTYSTDGINFQSSNIFNGLSSGVFTITVQDYNNCIITDEVEIQSEDSPIIEDAFIEHASCGNSNGSVTVITSGGTGALEHSIDGVNFQQNNVFDNLSHGFFTITLQDENLCVDTEYVEIQLLEGPMISSFEQKETTCNENNGSIKINVSQGMPPYEYSIDGNNFQTSDFFEDLMEGNYMAIVQDFEGCIDSLEIQLGAQEKPSISSVDIEDTTCGKANGEIEINISSGIEVEYSINGVDYLSSNSFENLAGRDYTIYIQDKNSCQDSQGVIIKTSEQLARNIETISTSCGKPNGSIIVEDIGGSEILEYSLNGIDFQNDNEFLDLDSGTYEVYLVDENDCSFQKDVEILSSSELSILSIQSTPADCNESNGGFEINIEGGIGQIQVMLDKINFDSNFTFDNIASGEYNIHIVDEAKCAIDTTITIPQEECPISIPNVFSPNGDMINDIFSIYPPPDFKGVFNYFRIYNRWGELVFEAQNFDPQNSGWDGTYKGKELEIGVYVYYVSYIQEDGQPKLLKGDVTLIK